MAQTDVFASDQMKPPWPDNTIILQAGFEQTLVFRDTDPEYVLDGKTLIISAATVRVKGKVVIRSFKQDAKSPREGVAAKGKDGPDGGNGDNKPPCLIVGCNGVIGDKGEDGKGGDSGEDAPDISLEFQRLTGSGSLIVAGIGQQGQQGQKGGRGGTGGRGGKGRKRDCSDPLPPGQGGYGGQGGSGGTGGRGGAGGKGSRLLVNFSLADSIAEGRLILYTGGGFGGFGGLGGDAGSPGPPGQGANGTLCFDGGPGGGDGPAGNLGWKGEQGKMGTGGYLSCRDCSDQNAEAFQSKVAPTIVPTSDILIMPMGAPVQATQDSGERRDIIASSVAAIISADGKDCIDLIKDAYSIAPQPQHICGGVTWNPPISSVHLLNASSVTFALFAPTRDAVVQSTKEICDVFLSCPFK